MSERGGSLDEGYSASLPNRVHTVLNQTLAPATQTLAPAAAHASTDFLAQGKNLSVPGFYLLLHFFFAVKDFSVWLWL